MPTTADGRACPIVVLSSVGNRDREAPDITAFLTKPVKPSALHDALVTVLVGRDVAAAPARATERPAIDAELGLRHPLRILLAEDNPVNQKLAIRLLAQMGYTTDVAGNGLEAIAALERAPYDVILMDVQMPELDGLEATRRIRAAAARPRRRPVDRGHDRQRPGRRPRACLAAGMNDYVSKPIRPAALAAALAVAPSSSRSPRACPPAAVDRRSRCLTRPSTPPPSPSCSRPSAATASSWPSWSRRTSPTARASSPSSARRSPPTTPRPRGGRPTPSSRRARASAPPAWRRSAARSRPRRRRATWPGSTSAVELGRGDLRRRSRPPCARP